MTRKLSLSQARRIAVAAQGLDRPRPKSVTVRHLRGAVERQRLLQIDSVNVLERPQYLVPFSRLGPYCRERFDALLYGSGEYTEQWAHEASIVPVATWPLLRYRMDAHRTRPWGFDDFFEENREYVDEALELVRRDGPLAADDLPLPPVPNRIDGTWTRTVQRCVLEAFFGRGELGVAERLPSFARTYDLVERVVPPELVALRYSTEECHRELLRQSAQAHGVGTLADLADYFRIKTKDARPRLEELVEEGEVTPVEVEGCRDTHFLSRGARVPRRAPAAAAALLSPFDPLVWFRKRAERLFDFEYRIEIYVPEAKRKYGYYVLPFLFGEHIVARVDLKADRAAKTLRVIGAWEEDGKVDADACAALARELWTLAGWLGLDEVRVGRRGALTKALREAVRTGPDPAPAAPEEDWSLYLVRCRSGELYTGIALDVTRRFEEHEAGKRGAKFLRGKGPLRLAFSQPVGPRGLALKLERRVKGLRRSEKEALIADPKRLTVLARELSG